MVLSKLADEKDNRLACWCSAALTLSTEASSSMKNSRSKLVTIIWEQQKWLVSIHQN